MSRQLRLAVTGFNGQLARSLYSYAPRDVAVIPLSRPTFNLDVKDSVLSSIKACNCDAIVSAAAYTAVDKAENEPSLVMRINGEGAGYVAEAAAALKIPVIHLSTDYVYDGALARPYREDDPTCPMSVYGRSKLEGEQKIRTVHSNHVILRTAWVYSIYGHNFVKTMLQISETKDVVRVVSDQIGNPTYAYDLAQGIFIIARRLINDNSRELRGIFHMVGEGEASWATFAKYIYDNTLHYRTKKIKVEFIRSVDYPTLARRPANSRLNTDKLKRIYGISLPQWQDSIIDCVHLLMKK